MKALLIEAIKNLLADVAVVHKTFKLSRCAISMNFEATLDVVRQRRLITFLEARRMD